MSEHNIEVDTDNETYVDILVNGVRVSTFDIWTENRLRNKLFYPDQPDRVAADSYVEPPEGGWNWEDYQ